LSSQTEKKAGAGNKSPSGTPGDLSCRQTSNILGFAKYGFEPPLKKVDET